MSKLSSGEVNLAVAWVSGSVFSFEMGINTGYPKGGVLPNSVIFYVSPLFVSFLALIIICNNFIRWFIYFVFFSLHFLLDCKTHERGGYLVGHIHRSIPVPGT